MTENSYFTLPNTNIQTLAPPQDLDFFDRQSLQLPKTIAPLDAWRLITSNPMPLLKLAFGVRDAISSLFGVKKIGGFSGKVPKTVKVGQKLDFFLVEHISRDVLTLTERDQHLDVMTCISTCDNTLSITSSVKVHNAFGRIYMVPVAPAHKMIVRNNLRQIKRHAI